MFVHMKRHPIFARDGTTLIAEAPISFTTAALGGCITMPQFRAPAVIDAIERHGVTDIIVVPSMLQSLLDDPSLPFSQPIMAQLHNTESGLCWEAVYGFPASKNFAGPPTGQFKNKAD